MSRALAVEPDYRLVAGLIWAEVAKLVDVLVIHPDMKFRSPAGAKRKLLEAISHPLITSLVKISVKTRPGSALSHRVDPIYKISLKDFEADLADAPWKRRRHARRAEGFSSSSATH